MILVEPVSFSFLVFLRILFGFSLVWQTYVAIHALS
jgi:hypothetical protein